MTISWPWRSAPRRRTRGGGASGARAARMPVRLTVLGSGSAGNATLLQCGEARVLLDVGLSCRETVRRLGTIGVRPRSGSGLFRGVCRLAGVPQS